MLVSIKIGSYNDQIWCDDLHMETTQLLLVRPWLYDLNIFHYDRENTYVFKYNEKTIKLFTIKSTKKRSITPPT